MELYCIKHGRMEKAQHMFDSFNIYHPDGVEDERAIVVGFIHEEIISDGLNIPVDIDWCEFEMGWATCPPPKFDMDLFMETVEEPSWKEMAEASINGMSETEQK